MYRDLKLLLLTQPQQTTCWLGLRVTPRGASEVEDVLIESKVAVPDSARAFIEAVAKWQRQR
jgi:hypothetical protein